jgi:hypothetical protein
MIRHKKARLVCLLAVVVASAGCNDNAPSTAPAVTPGGATLNMTAARPRPRGPYISDLQLASISIPITASDDYTPYTVTVTNPGPKDFPSIYLKGELQSVNFPATPVTAFLAYCPYPNGIVPRGNCTMSHGITPTWGLIPGPATFTLRVLQQQADGTMTALDVKSVDVVLVQ